MNKTLVRKWIEALRSGRYSQGIGKLRDGDRFCCLGVACDIFDPKGWGGDIYLYGKEIGMSYPPDKISDLLGLSMDAQEFLSIMNDAEGKNFAEIASWIEENLETKA